MEEEGRRSTSDFDPARGEERGAEPASEGRPGLGAARGRDTDRSPHRHTGTRTRVRLNAQAPTLAPRQLSPDARLPRGRRGRTGPPQTHPQPTGPHGPAWATATKPLSSTPRGATFPPHTPPRDQARRAAAAAAAGTPFKPQLPPARRAALPPGTPRPPRGPCAPGCPTVRRGPAARPRVGQTRSERDGTASGRGGGSEPAERGPSTAGPAAAAPLPRETPHKGPGGRSGGDRAREPNRRESHCTQPGAVPPRPRHRADPKPTDTPGSPRRRQPTRERTEADADANRRRPPRGSGPQRPTTRQTRPTARSPKIRSPPPESEAKPRGSRTLESPAEGEGGVGGLPRSPPAVGTLPWKGGTRRQPQTPESTRHAPHATRPRRESGRDVDAHGRDAHATEGTGETGRRVGPGAHRRPSKPTRPATTPRGEGGYRARGRVHGPSPATCHQKPNLPHKLRTAAGRQSPVPRDPSSYSERGGAGRGRRESKRCAQKAEVRAGTRGDHPGEAGDHGQRPGELTALHPCLPPAPGSLPLSCLSLLTSHFL